MPEPVYVVRYGTWNHLGRFVAASDDPPLPRSQQVVIRTARGLELGEVLAGPQRGTDEAADGANGAGSRIVRPATLADRQAAEASRSHRSACLAACQAVFGTGTWPIEFLDAECLPALDGQPMRALLSYLGPHDLDTAGLVELFRERFGLHVAFEPVGQDVPEDDEADADADADGHDAHGCGSGSCGSGGCGSGGGCGTAGGGCSGCAVAGLARQRSTAGGRSS